MDPVPGPEHEVPTSALASVHVVLNEPRDAVNIGATIRAMKNMGLRSLRLVRPVEFDPYRLISIAHDTHELIEGMQYFETLDAAIADCVRVAGFTARRRAAKRGIVGPREAAGDLLRYVPDGPVALVFGREDRGLSNEDLDRAHVLVTIPTTAHASLNVAQAVIIALYELHVAAGDATREVAPPRKDAPPATGEQMELLFADVHRALEAVDFLKTRFPEHVLRTIRSLAFRAAPDAREIQLLRAMAIEVLRTIDRVRRDAARDS